MNASDGPYVGLDCFRETDAGLFFGRDAERTRIIGNLRASRLTLLYAESGVGKSSLLRAGVSARLNEPTAGVRGGGRYVTVVFSEWGPSPTPALIESLASAARRLPGARQATPRRDGLAHAIADVSDATGATLLVILDQFEERFVYAPADERRLRRRARGVHRRPRGAGALPHLGARGRLRAHRRAVQEPASRTSTATTCISTSSTRPPRAGRSSSPWRRSTGASPTTRRGGTSSPRSSTPCWSEVRRGRVTIGDDAPAGGGDRRRRARRDRLPAARDAADLGRGVDRRLTAAAASRRCGGSAARARSSAAHVDDALTGMPDAERDAASEALRFLVTSGGRKIALSTKELREFTDAPPEPLESALEHARAPPDPPAGRRIGAGRRGPPGAVPRRARAGGARLAPPPRGRATSGGRPTGGWRRPATGRGSSRSATAASRRRSSRWRRPSSGSACTCSILPGCSGWTSGPSTLASPCRTATRPIRGWRSSRWTTRPWSSARGATAGSRAPTTRRILDRVRRDGPAVMALDVIFRTAGDAAEDRQLQSAIRRSGQALVLPYDEGNLRVLREADGDPTARALLFGRRAAGRVPHRFRRASRRPGRHDPAREPRRRHRTLGVPWT